MPRREDIEKFAHVLTSLGDEPAIRAARSETIEEEPAPEEEPQPGGEIPGGESTGEQPGEGAGTEEQAGLQDLFEGLSAVPGEEAETMEPEPGLGSGEQAGEGEGAEGAEALDFGSLFGDEAPPQGIEDFDQTPPPAGDSTPSPLEGAPAEGAPAEGAPAEGAPGEEPFSFPEGEPANLQSDISQMEVLPEEGAASAAGEPAPSEPAPSEPAGPFGDLGDFSFDTPDTTPAEPSAEAAFEPGPEAAFEPGAESAPDQPGAENLELPDLDDLSFAEPSTPAEFPSSAAGGESDLEPRAGGTEGAGPLEALPESDVAAAGGFDLDSVSFEQEGPKAGAAATAAAAAPEEEAPIIEGVEEETLGGLDEFSLPESAQRFGVQQPLALKPAAGKPQPRPARPEQGPRRQPGPGRPAPVRPAPGTAGKEPTEEILLTPEQFGRLKKTLETLPRNLKIAVQDLIGEGTATGADLSRMIGLLLSGATAQEIAGLASRIGGRRIRVPAGYEKKTGEAFEAEQRTFGYAFRQNILPLARVVAITLIAGAIFGYLGYRYVYRPLSALGAYRAGYTQLLGDNYALANEKFAGAVRVWAMKRWYFRYAEGFADKRQYILAEEKYEQLLAEFGYDKKALLDYAGMETTVLSDSQKADSLLKRILDRSPYDYDALLAAGDNDIEWAASDGARYEAARLSYATLLDRYGVKDEVLFRMLRYFIRTDNGLEVERLRAYYATRPDVKVSASVYAELGGYLVDHRRLDDVQQVLFRADKADPALYEVHYSLARYYRTVGLPEDEKSALDHVVTLLKLRSAEALTRKRLATEIDTHTRLGEWWYAQKRYIDAANELRTAVDLIERNQRMKLLPANRMFGRPYAALGNLFYEVQGDLAGAEVQYRNAIANLYTSPSLTYRIGFIQYDRGDYKAAMTTFAATEDATAYPSGNEAEPPALAESAAAATTVAATATGPAAGAGSATAAAVDTAGVTAAMPGQVPPTLLYALGNAFFMRGDFFAAQGSYLRLLSRLETRRSAIGTLSPDTRSLDRTLLLAIARVDNNLGVTMLRLSERTGDRKKRSEALVYLTAATEISDSLARNIYSAQRSENRSLASLNMRGILYPTARFEPQIDRQLPRDIETTSW